MNIINEPLLPSGQVDPNSDPGASPDRTRNPNHVLDNNVLDQMRSLLIDAGVTASLLDLPDIDFSTGQGAPETSTASLRDDADAEKGAAKRPSLEGAAASNSSTKRWMGSSFKLLNAMASRRIKAVHDTTKEYNITEDIYMMMFMSKNWTLPFLYAVTNIFQKLTLFGIVIYWIYRPGGFRDEQMDLGATPPIVQATQFLLTPVAIGITEELLITLDVLGKMGWTKLEAHPHATSLKYHIANILRALDGIVWLFIIASLMFYAVDVLNMFLNFAALQFLQSVDNAAYDMAKGGYLPKSLEIVALDVAKTTLPSRRGTWMEYADTMFLVLIQLLLVIWWALVNFPPEVD